ncbi:MCE family protein [Flavobacteriaceae bacterium XHP0103]|uniref:MlaD family protein n=1 Tax=Marixanthotalea marina TaxID=2844359 RepID=UPI002989C4E3|nr:MlaD family protein [Marixanthotalea marina]MBU3821494.1 MCE family protein [Marixanthotalea marina]
MKISKEVKTAVLVILGIALFIFGFNYLKGQNLFESTDVYYTKFDYNALTKASTVTVNGNVVGKVQDIVYNYETGKTIISFTVSNKLDFAKSSKIRMYETGLMGGNGLAIINSYEGETAKYGDTLQSEVEPGLITSLTKNFSGISDNLDTTLKSTDSLINNLNRMVEDDSEAGLKRTIAELNGTLKSFKQLSNSANGLISQNDENISAILANFKTTSQNLSAISSELKEAELGTTLDNLSRTVESLNKVLTSVENGQGSMGKLVKDEALYNNLEAATKELEELLRDIKLHPKRYFRILSKKEIPYTPETAQ